MLDLIHILLIIACLLSVVVLAQCLKVGAMNDRFDELLRNHGARLDRHHAAIAGHTDSLQELRRRLETLESPCMNVDPASITITTQSNPIPEIVRSHLDRRNI